MYTVLLWVHFLGLALGVGTGFANLTLGMAARKLEPQERTAFMMRASVLGRNGSIGLLLLLLSGLGMTTLRGWTATFAWGGPAFHAKLTLIAIFIGVFGYLQMLVARVKREGGGPTMAKLPKVSGIMLLLAVGIMTCAVLAFH